MKVVNSFHTAGKYEKYVLCIHEQQLWSPYSRPAQCKASNREMLSSISSSSRSTSKKQEQEPEDKHEQEDKDEK